VALSITLALYVLLPRSAYETLLSAVGFQVSGNERDEIEWLYAAGALALSALVCHVAGVLARSARLARELGADLERSLVANDSSFASVEVEDGSAAGRTGSLERSVRIAVRLVTDLIFWGIVFGALWAAIDRVASSLRAGEVRGWQHWIVFGLSVGLLLLAALQLALYFLIRLRRIQEAGREDRPLLRIVRSVLDVLLWLSTPILRIVLRPWRLRPGSTTPLEGMQALRELSGILPPLTTRQQRQLRWQKFLRRLFQTPSGLE
jgi:hypothetical protein